MSFVLGSELGYKLTHTPGKDWISPGPGARLGSEKI